ncbi:hypothetical protein ACCW94_02900 [Enterobacter soli]|uniref:hypothetical protein n=1 Tax=Enterobacter soli TaxID=885040 RepID=UPI003ED9482D
MSRWNDLSKPAHADEWADAGEAPEADDYLEREREEIADDNAMDFDYNDWN